MRSQMVCSVLGPVPALLLLRCGIISKYCSWSYHLPGVHSVQTLPSSLLLLRQTPLCSLALWSICQFSDQISILWSNKGPSRSTSAYPWISGWERICEDGFAVLCRGVCGAAGPGHVSACIPLSPCRARLLPTEGWLQGHGSVTLLCSEICR